MTEISHITQALCCISIWSNFDFCLFFFLSLKELTTLEETEGFYVYLFSKLAAVVYYADIH